METTNEEEIKILAIRITNDKGVIDPLKLSKELLKIIRKQEINERDIFELELGEENNRGWWF
jgi:hypothetical protein